MIRTLVIGVDPDKDTPAFASVWVGEDYSIDIRAVGLGDDWVSIPFLSMRIPYQPTRVFIESPRAEYTKGKGTRVQDIVELARRAGELSVACACAFGIRPDYITPAEWKGQTPKDISQARICSRLGWPFEKMAGYARPTDGFSGVRGATELKKSDWKHVLDAIGIALWGADTIISIDRRAAAVASKARPTSEPPVESPKP